MIEPPVVRVEVCMVFASPPSSVASRLKDFPNYGSVTEIPIASMVIKPSEQTDPGGPTLRGVVRLGIADAVLGQAIQVGRLDLTSITSEIGIPHIVRKN